MSLTLARVGFYVVAFFIVIVFVKMLIDKAQELKTKKMFGKNEDKNKEDVFK